MPDQPAASSPLPAVITSRPASESIAALATAARRGRLAGFKEIGPASFQADAFGSPFDGQLEGQLDGRADSAAGVTTLRFSVRLKPAMPWVAAIVLLATVWPGVTLTESLVASFFPGSAAWQYTWWWYMPLTVPFAPWAYWSAVKKSRAAAHASALEVIAKVAKELSGRLDPPPPASESPPPPAANSPGPA